MSGTPKKHLPAKPALYRGWISVGMEFVRNGVMRNAPYSRVIVTEISEVDGEVPLITHSVVGSWANVYSDNELDFRGGHHRAYPERGGDPDYKPKTTKTADQEIVLKLRVEVVT